MHMFIKDMYFYSGEFKEGL